MDDDEELETIRLALWTLFAAATHAAGGHEGDATRQADATLAAAEQRFPFLRPPPDPTGGLAP